MDDQYSVRQQAWQAFHARDLQRAAALAGDLAVGDECDHDAQHLLGLVAVQSGQLALAERLLARAVRLRPDCADYLNNLATVLIALGRRDDAIALYRQAAALTGSGAAEAHFNLVLTLAQAERSAEAAELLELKAQSEPLSPRELDALGSCYYYLNRYEEAETMGRQAVDAVPGNSLFLFNYGNALVGSRQPGEAEVAFRKVLSLSFDFPEAHVALASALISQGKLTEGWPELDWHWRQDKSLAGIRPFPQPEWKGLDLAGRSLLVWMEQGIGDEIEYASLLGDAIAQAGHVLIECEPRLVSLFARSFPEAEVFARQLSPNPRLLKREIDYQINAGGLLAHLRTRIEDFPHEGGFLRADPDASAFWCERLAGLGAGLKIGFSWRSKFVDQARSFHYSTLDEWAGLFALPGIRWINLQYDQCDDELDAAEQKFGITLHRFAGLDLMNDLDGAAALTSALDLVISPANSVTMMAGALGVPTWMATYDAMNWHMLGTSGHAFLPGVRIFPRVLPASWADVFSAMADVLRTRLNAPGEHSVR